jgi:MCP family monocarboxylic acid transporter-like MFS transporter 3
MQVNSFARDVIGLSNVEAVGALLIVSGMGIPVRPIVGYLGDNYIGPINVYIIGLTCLSAVTFAWTAVKTRTALYIFCVFFGMTIGCAQGIFVGALASLTKDPQKMGTRYGMVTTLIGFATLAGPPTGGAIIGQSGGKYVWAQIWGGFVALLAAMAVAVARLNMTGMRLRAKA